MSKSMFSQNESRLIKSEPILCQVSELYLDSQNPRIVEAGLSENTPQKELLSYLWSNMAVEEVAMSIATNGYWDYDPMIALNEGGRLIIIEGNRRLAAVKILLDTSLRKELKATDLPSLPSSEATRLSEKGLPVIIVESRSEVWTYLGFKHVNGPAKWSSFAKGKYIAEVHRSGIPLSTIADQIGDRHRSVQRLFRAYMVLEQAEKSKVWNRELAYKGRLYFSHLMTGLDYEEFKSFLNITEAQEESPNPVPKDRLENLRNLCVWLWGEKETPPKVMTQNPDLSRLRDILGDKSESGIRSLQRGESIDVAFELSKDDEKVFGSSLIDAKHSLQKAQGRVTTGFNGQRNLLDLMESISQIASGLYDSMARITRKGKISDD